MARHKHADLIIAWANGAKIQLLKEDGTWWYTKDPLWSTALEYRIKPEPKPDVVLMFYTKTNWMIGVDSRNGNLKITYDGETSEPKTKEIINKEK